MVFKLGFEKSWVSLHKGLVNFEIISDNLFLSKIVFIMLQICLNLSLHTVSFLRQVLPIKFVNGSAK